MFSVTTLQTVATFIIILGILVFFHELGHFWVAKLFRMRVEEFALGFGPRLLRVGYDGQTEYNIRVVPLGGFVRIAGMEIEDAMERRLTGTPSAQEPAHHAVETTNVGLIEQEAAEVSGAEPDGFNSRPVYQRFLVILAGPVFSVVLGWLAFCLIGVIYGLPMPDAKPTTRIAAVDPNGVAAQAGLTAGDTVIAVQGQRISEWDKMVDVIRGSAGKRIQLTVRGQGDTERTLTMTPRAKRVEGKEVGQIGVIPAVPTRRVGVVQSFSDGTQFLVLYMKALGYIFASGQAKDNVGGPIAIFQGTREAVSAGGSSPLELLGKLSLSIGIFNLLPIPVLDGGHIALLTLEAVRGRKLTAEQTQRVLTTGLAIIAVLFLYVMFNDITRLFRRG